MYVACRPQRFGKRIYELSERTKGFAVMYLPQRKCNSMPNCLCMLSPMYVKPYGSSESLLYSTIDKYPKRPESILPSGCSLLCLVSKFLIRINFFVTICVLIQAKCRSLLGLIGVVLSCYLSFHYAYTVVYRLHATFANNTITLRSGADM